MTYSTDLREKIVRAVDEGVGSQRMIAELFGVSRSFVEKLLARRRQTGSIAARAHGGGRKPAYAAEQMHAVRRLVEAQPDATLDELRERVARDEHVSVSRATMGRVVLRLGLVRKKSRFTPPSATPRASAKHALRTIR